MDQEQPPKPKRRLRFSLRTLLIVVLVYAGLWAVTAVWGGRQLERRVAQRVEERVRGCSDGTPRIDLDRVRWLIDHDIEPRESPPDAYWAVETCAYAPFVLQVSYVYTELIQVGFSQQAGNEEPQQSRMKLTGYVRRPGRCLMLWFFGATRCLNAEEKEPLFGSAE